LDFLSIRTHAPGQLKYNPVERGMATLSGKLAGITLPVDHFGGHLNTQGKVIDPELAARNFRYSGEALCEIWRRDLIFGKKSMHVISMYSRIHLSTCTLKERKKKRLKN
jgi:hypothetical protein